MIRLPRRHRNHDLYATIPNPLRRLSLRVLDAIDLLVYALVGIAFIGAAVLVAEAGCRGTNKFPARAHPRLGRATLLFF